MSERITSLQDRFVESKGSPLLIDGRKIIQMDEVRLPDRCDLTIRFVGERVFEGNAAVIAIDRPGKIFLPDGSFVNSLITWDDPGLPREMCYRISSAEKLLRVYNKYRVRHSADFVTEDNFTGNAGITIIDVGPGYKRYGCSNGPKSFSPDDLVFEVEWIEIRD